MNNDKNIRVLLVDDEPRITELLAFSLRKEQYIIETATSGPEALKTLKERPVEIVVTDIRMPEMDGFELCQHVMELYPATQVIIISAHGDVESAVEALKIGAVDFLQKPIDPKVLLLSLNSSAEKWHLRQTLNASIRDLEKEKELLSVTLNSIGDGVIATDLDGNVTMLNKISSELTGWSARDARGKPLSEVFNIINEKTRKPCENPVAKVLATGRIIGLANHTALISKDGAEHSIADSAAPIRNRDSEVIGTVLVFRDVTLKNKVNAELAKTKQLESVGILAGGIAHDFNNILTGIMGNISLARIKMDTIHKSYDLLEAAERAAIRAGKLTRQLLTFSKGGAPILEVNSIYDVVRESAEFTLTGSGIACRIEQDRELWSADIDRGQIDQVIQNIVLNARQAMPEGGTIHIVCENFTKLEADHNAPQIEIGDYVCVAITDEGVGIQSSLLEKIFDPYFSTKQEGSGLGMAITQSIIHKHRGSIECSSILGEGTCFTFFLPAVKTAVTDTSQVRGGHHGAGKVMIMDDELMIRSVTDAMLSRCGYTVIHAKDGSEALVLYETAMNTGEPFDAVIMDLTIPGGMGGKEAMAKLKQLDPSVKAIVSSGYSNDPVMANYDDYVFVACLVKPFLMDDLTDVLSKALSTETLSN
ncbi:MAG: response regulator [Pseudomonadales bacterium]|nr:response regulator [Pseudomonadales bacterium]